MWTSIENLLPPEEMVVETKISDEKGDRNFSDLVLYMGRFFFPDMSMYVYYTPTHWREKSTNIWN